MNRNKWFIECTGNEWFDEWTWMNDSLNEQEWKIINWTGMKDHLLDRNEWFIEWTEMSDSFE